MRKYFILMLLLLVGCTTTTSEDIQLVTDNYATVVFDDGITVEEAKVIAQKQVVKKNMADIYDLSKPQVADDIEELPSSEDYWFISFEERKPGNIPFVFMVVIDGAMGKVEYADDFNEGNRWILEAALLR